ncbi:protein kinase [Actinospica sp. MGRD01-02]|uniref:non-specific serine/threonine protein kinase n=1 Tax=Actinospica acidithermotolerans TaxID=2828514 RepID=A0A941EHY2_9ACTN|nr:serine/threonine-protein kinase [Actinospica acidithermotolerans]MBR7830842.1 protein kinase [Actinospica acidithermotolerans]
MLRLGGDDPQRLGTYRLRAVIGDGGMGRVYLATSQAGRAVAVKVIGPGLANQPGYRERFAREARAAMSVSGLYTASVVDADTAGERPYIATEYVPAPSLAESVAKTGPMPNATVFALAGGLAEALVAIHRAGLVHRDVKPHNILLAADGPVVIDFGIAMGDETSLTAVGMVVGTPGFIAPEVLRGKDPSALSDVFSLGCVLVYAARGTGPFGTGDPLAIAHRSATGEPDLTGVPGDVKALVTPMLHREPSRRPSPAQLLQHVSVSSNVMLHDGQWLPDGVRGLLSERKRELQQALGSQPVQAPQGPLGVQAPQPAHPQQPAPAYQQSVFPPTPPNDFAAMHGGVPVPTPTPARSRTGFYALLAAAGAVVMAGAIAGVLLLDHGKNGSSNSANGGTTGVAVVHSSSAATDSATDSATSDTATGATDSSTSGSDSGSTTYKPGTYGVDQQIAVDLLGDTVDVDSVTVNNDGSVAVKLTYTSAVSGTWSCGGSKAGEATLQIGDNGEDSSTASDCTKAPSKTWDMNAGQTFSGSEYFASAPAGSGSWTFSMDTATTEGITEFQGSVSDISIPTQ